MYVHYEIVTLVTGTMFLWENSAVFTLIVCSTSTQLLNLLPPSDIIHAGHVKGCVIITRYSDVYLCIQHLYKEARRLLEPSTMEVGIELASIGSCGTLHRIMRTIIW